MDELISRQAAIEDIRTTIPKDARFDIKWIEMWLMQLPSGLSTNLAEVGMDCISRQAAIDATKKHYRAHDNDLLELIAFDIERLPSAEPKRGRWIGKYPVTSVCSECGFLIHDSKVKVFAYCPNCGAKMERRTDEA